MAIVSGFFRSDNGDRRYTAEVFASYFASFIGNGVFPNPSSGLQITPTTGTTVNVQPGKGWINGYYVSNTTPYPLTLGVADGVLSRIDRIVLQWNSDTREIGIEVLQGTPSGNPVAPALTRGVNVYELALADIRIQNGTVNITQSMITDQRPNTPLCGFVTGVVQQVDTSTLFNQYQEVTLQNIAADQARFDAFLADLENALDGNVATALNNRITQVENGLQVTTESLQEFALTRNNPNGLATLDENGLLTASQVRPYRLTTVNFETPGSTQWTVPNDVTTIWVSAVAGGGGGRGSGGNGGTGGFTSLGSLMTLTGGGGGTSSAPGVAGGYGATSGDGPISGTKGGMGGGSLFGQGSYGLTQSNNPTVSVGRGAGGGGVHESGYGGGGGAGVLDRQFNVTPGSVIPITVGSGGAAGSAASFQNAGRPGGAGFLQIKYIQ